MIEQRELLSLLIAAAVVVYLSLHSHRLRRVRHYRPLLASFLVLAASWFCSVIEGFFWEDGFNTLQHFFSGLSAILLAIWCRRVYLGRS